MTLVHIDAASKRFGHSAVLRNISFSMNAGEFVVLIGGSGSGKTTLLRLIAGLERADTGCLSLRNEIVDQPQTGTFIPAERRGLGMVFQDYALWPHFTCLQNIEAAARGTATLRRKRALELLDRMELQPFAAKRPHELSGGQQQRVGIARALAANPDLLLCDEALSSLDSDIRERLRLEIRLLARESGTAVLFVSHDPLDAWRLADRIAVLENGALIQTATPDSLYARPGTARIARFIGATGGFAAAVDCEDGQSGIRLDGRFVPACVHPLKLGQTGIVYIRPEGVRIAETGIPAELQFCAFEAGSYRAYWRIAGSDAKLCSREAVQPPPSARLRIAPDHVLVFPLTETQTHHD
ncbi:MAG: ABC transporter ATP-binding protein [Alphaproteobacteria bacterium]|nr:ABC transporter ATP-binding protein [Alphaproteobacteria bacterium]